MSGRGGCLLWLAVPAVVLVTTGGATGERGLAAVVASPVQPLNWRYSPIYIVMYGSVLVSWCAKKRHILTALEEL